MKRVKSIFPAMMLCMSVICSMAFVSCDSKEDEPAVPAAKSVAGEYTNSMTVTVMGSESVFENVTYTIVATSDSKVDVQISAFGNPPMRVPAFTVKDVVVSGTDGNYTLAETQFSGTTEAGKAYSGTLAGTVADNTLTANMSLQYGAMPMPMICSFTATKK